MSQPASFSGSHDMRDANQVTRNAGNVILPLDQDRIAQIRDEIYDDMCGFPEAAAAISKSVRTLERLVREFCVPVYRIGCTRQLKPRELRSALEAGAQRQLEERQQAKLPRPVGRPRTAAQASPKVGQPRHATQGRQGTART
jgi:hypothetical protein